jgi:hypothetical protein
VQAGIVHSLVSLGVRQLNPSCLTPISSKLAKPGGTDFAEHADYPALANK